MNAPVLKKKQLFYFILVVILTVLTPLCFFIISSKKSLFYPATKITFLSMASLIFCRQLISIVRTHVESQLNKKQALGFWLTFGAAIFVLDLLLHYGVTDTTSCGFITLTLLSVAFALLSFIDQPQYALNGVYLYLSVVVSIISPHALIILISLSILTLLFAYRWHLRG